MFLRASLAALILAPGLALAAGSSDSEPPTPTATTTECEAGKVWDEKTSACLDVKSDLLDDDTLYRAARELAWAGRPEEALIAIAQMSNQSEDRVLTYKGFANRKAGRIEEGMAFYAAALAQNPDNLLARSYMGQGLVDQGETELARAQLTEIVARGGAGSWAEASLRTAIATGVTYTY
jgi:tetratricopeptide (TPR) repeat protein